MAKSPHPVNPGKSPPPMPPQPKPVPPQPRPGAAPGEAGVEMITEFTWKVVGACGVLMILGAAAALWGAVLAR